MSTRDYWRCWFGFHRWGKWQDATATRTASYFGVVVDERPVECQVRYCENCGQRDVRDG